MILSFLLIGLLFFFIAIIYASVGLGGGSSYIAILVLMGLAAKDIRLLTLVCNIVVVGGASWRYYHAGLLDFGKILPIILASIPLAYIGGTFLLEDRIYKLVVGIVLLLVSILLLLNAKDVMPRQKASPLLLAILGGGIGFLSGVIGVGGGVFLSPVLYLSKWESPKKISAMTSFFILVNSIAGLMGQKENLWSLDPLLFAVTVGAVFVGGRIGTHLNMKMLSPEKIKLYSAILVGFVALRILFSYV